jgi:polar amino acid transport system substrate-binding protein
MTTVDWPPFYGANLPKNGPVTEIAVEAFRRSGHTATITFQPWARALHSGQTKKVDVVMGAYYTRERAMTIHYSAPVMRVEIGIIAPKSTKIDSFKNLRELSKYSIGVSKGWANSPEFDAADFLKKDTSRNPSTNLKKLIHGRIDMMVMSLEVFKYELKTEGLSNNSDDYKVIHPILSNSCLHMLVHKDIEGNKELIDDFNKGLKSMKLDGTYMKILKSHGISETAAEPLK